MHVAYFAQFLGPRVIEQRCQGRPVNAGGTQKIRTISQALVRVGHRVTILSPGLYTKTGRWQPASEETLELEEGSIDILYCAHLDVRGMVRGIGQFVVPRFFRNQHQRRGFDCVIVYNPGQLSAAAAEAAQALGIPVVLEYEDSALLYRPKSNGRKPLSRVIDELVPFCAACRTLKRLRSIISGGLVVCDELAEQLGTGNYAVIHGAIDTDLFEATALPAERIGAGLSRVVYAGTLDYDKGADLLVEALSFVKEPVDLHLYGSGPLQSRIQSLLKTVPRHHKATLEGYVARNRLITGLTRAHVLVNPQRVNIGIGMAGNVFPFKIVEYASTGVPVVSSALGRAPAQLLCGVQSYDADTPQALAGALQHVLSTHDKCLVAAEQSKDYARGRYCIEALGNQITSVLERARLQVSHGAA